MRYLRLIKYFMLSSAQEDLAYRANFFIGLLHSLLNLIVGVLGLAVLFGQVETVNGWSFAATLALLGVYLVVSALRGLFIGPSLEALAGWKATSGAAVLTSCYCARSIRNSSSACGSGAGSR